MPTSDKYAYEADVKQWVLDNGYLFSSDKDAIAIFEKLIYRVRVDCLIMDKDKITGIEIKTNHDTNKRLEHQLKEYLLICDKVYVLVHDEMYPKVVDIVNEYPKVGIICYNEINNRIVGGLLRGAKDNQPSYQSQLWRLLWGTETRSLAASQGLPVGKLSRRKVLNSYLLSTLGPKKVSYLIRQMYMHKNFDPEHLLKIQKVDTRELSERL